MAYLSHSGYVSQGGFGSPSGFFPAGSMALSPTLSYSMLERSIGSMDRASQTFQTYALDTAVEVSFSRSIPDQSPSLRQRLESTVSAGSGRYSSPEIGYGAGDSTGSIAGRHYHWTAHSHPEYHSTVSFLDPHRPTARFIGKGHDIQHYIKQAFTAVTGKKLPGDIVISVVSEEELQEKHNDFGGKPSAGLQGFSINNPGFRIVIVKENPLDQLMLTIGHELGHVMTPTLHDGHDEEAKAFAFEMAWLEAITSNDIAGLGSSFITPAAPAQNGLHNIAFSFVKNMIEQGKHALQVHKELISNGIEVKHHALL
ncbi:hypothetical protein HYS47_03190 [Candidatus Woesearchaeota archaeon]|nr:hypothetical protein [Candidatus Woesearchaeota archaeon]